MKKVGKYEVLGELGHGAMGVVYRARDPIINRLVALKTITTGVADDPAMLQRFYREAQSAGGLQHPNIVTIYDMGESGNLPYIAMELVEGENLEQVIARKPNLPIALKLVYAMQACRAFDYAHKRGIVHRDIKPGNVMLGKDGTVKVVDFGIARVLEASRTQTGMLIGTFAYMSPEQYHGEHADERSDIWSFGVMLYELLCYERPFKGQTPASLMHSICQENPNPLKKFVADCPDELEIVITRVLQKVPAQRYQSMEDVLLELDPVCKKLQVRLVADLIEESRKLLEQEEFTQARDLVRQALQVDSGNPQARALFEKANAELRRLQLRPNVQQFIDKGRALLEEGKFEEARGAAESALQLDSTFAPAQELRVAADREIEHARARAETLEAAKQRLAEGLPEEAEEFLAKILQAEPNNAQALRLQAQVEAEKIERRRRAELQEGLRRVRELWTQQKYAECIGALTELEKSYPGEDEIPRLLESVRDDQLEQQKQKTLLEARNLLAAGRHAECLEILANLQKTFPADEEIPRLEEEVRRDQMDRRRFETLTAARRLLADGEYENCIALLSAASQEFANEPEIPRLLESARQSQEEQRRQQALEQARKHFAGRRFEKCLAALAALEKEFPGDAEVVKLRETVRAEQREERKEKQLQEARNLLESKQYDALLKHLASVEKEFPGETEIQELLESALKEQAEQRKRESLAQARKFLAAKKYEEAIAALQKLQGEFPAETEVRRLLQSTRDEQAEHNKQQVLGEARGLLRANRYLETIALLEKLQGDFPTETEVRKLLGTAREELREQEKQKKLNEARSLLAAQSFDEALALLNSLGESFPKDTAVLKLLTLVQREQEKFVRAARIQQELDALKKLMGERKYPEVVARTKKLLAEFPGETQFQRLAEFANSQQAQIERETLLRTTLEEAKGHFAASRFEQAVRAAKIGLQDFPGNVELTGIAQQAETQQRKLEIRQQIEMRVREIRVKINREQFSDAVDLAKETLVTLGPDTDLTQLLNSAQVEIEAREKKRKQERALETIRTLMDSGDLNAAQDAVDDALKTEVVESYDPRIQRLSQQIEDAKQRVEQKSAPPVAPVGPPMVAPAPPSTLSREYAFLEAPPLPGEPTITDARPAVEPTAPAQPSHIPLVISPQGSAGTPALEVPQTETPVPEMAQPAMLEPVVSEAVVAEPVIPEPSVAGPEVPAVAVPEPQMNAGVAEPEMVQPAIAPPAVSPPVVPEPVAPEPVAPKTAEPEVDRAAMAKRPVRIAKPAPVAQEPERPVVREIPAPVPEPAQPAAWRKPALIGMAALALVGVVWGVVHFVPSSKNEGGGASSSSGNGGSKPVTAAVNPLETQQREALDAANKLIAENDLNGALQTLQTAAALNGPLTPEIVKKEAEISASMKDANLRQLRQNEERLWQRAVGRIADGHFGEAQKDLRQILALPAGGVHREDAQNYLDKVIPQRMQQGSLTLQAQQALRVGDFQAARQAGAQLRQAGGDPGALLAQIDQQEQARLAQLEAQFNQLKQRDDDASVQQLKGLQPKFQALAADGGPQTQEAMNYANAVASAASEMQASAQKKVADAAFQRAVQRYQQASGANDKNGLAAVRGSFQSMSQGGPYASEAQRYMTEIDNKLTALNTPPPVSAPPPPVKEVAPHSNADAEAEVRATVQRYAQAFQQRNADALRQVWPNIGSNYGRYKQSFDLASSIEETVTIQSVAISPDGASAVVRGRQSQAYTPKAGKPQRISGDLLFNLEKSSRGTWIISDVQ